MAAQPTSEPAGHRTGSGSLSSWRRHQLTENAPAAAAAELSRDWSQQAGTASTPPPAARTRPVTALGAGLAVGAVLALLAGWWTGWAELTVAGVTAAAVLVLSAVFLVGRSSYQVGVDLHDARVVAGVRATGAIVVRNSGSRRLLPVGIELPVGSSTATFRVPSLAPGAAHEELFVVPTARRAVISVGPALSVRGDPLGLLRRQVRWTVPTELYVHPRTVALAGTSTGSVKDLEGSPSTELSSSDVSFHALREYAAGDDPRHVHWTTSARTYPTTGVLMVRQFEETRRTHLVVALSVDAAEYATEAEFELAVSAAASLGVQAFREERPVTVLAGATPLVASSARRLLDACAGIVPDPRGGALVAGREAGVVVPNASMGVLVTGSAPSPAVLRRAAAGFAVGIATTALRTSPGARLALARIGGTDVATLGRLDDLGRALRRMRSR